MKYKTFKQSRLDPHRTKWSAKLAASGFDDAEKEKGQLKQWHSTYFQSQYTADQFQEKLAYYQLAGNFLHNYTFANETERLVWELHAAGQTLNAIHPQVGLSRSKVQRLISRLAGEMSAGLYKQPAKKFVPRTIVRKRSK